MRALPLQELRIRPTALDGLTGMTFSHAMTRQMDRTDWMI